jgi:hypothetical protein
VTPDDPKCEPNLSLSCTLGFKARGRETVSLKELPEGYIDHPLGICHGKSAYLEVFCLS